MPRRARSFKRRVPVPDPKFNSTKYAKFINYLMERGKKSTAQKIFYQALETIGEKLKADPSFGVSKTAASNAQAQSAKPARGKKAAAPTEGDAVTVVAEDVKKLDPRDVFDAALKNVCPILEVKGRRIGGSNYQVPMEVPEPRKTTLGMKWMITAARARKGMPMHERLAAEVMDAFQSQGAAFKKRLDVQRMAEANRAFAHFARFGQKRK